MENIIQIAKLAIRGSFGITFFIVTIIGSLFVLFSISYFLLPQLATLSNFPSDEPGLIAAFTGTSMINMFAIFLSIFLSLVVLLNQFKRNNLLFLLAKPISTGQLLLGASLGLMLTLFCFWAILSLELIIIMSIFAKSFTFITILALLPILLNICIYVALTVFFFTLLPNYISAIFPFLIILASLGRNDLRLLILRLDNPFFSKLAGFSLFFIPRIGEAIALSATRLGAIDVHINTSSLLIHTVFIVLLLYTVSTIRISNILDRV